MSDHEGTEAAPAEQVPRFAGSTSAPPPTSNDPAGEPRLEVSYVSVYVLFKCM